MPITERNPCEAPAGFCHILGSLLGIAFLLTFPIYFLWLFHAPAMWIGIGSVIFWAMALTILTILFRRTNVFSRITPARYRRPVRERNIEARDDEIQDFSVAPGMEKPRWSFGYDKPEKSPWVNA